MKIPSGKIFDQRKIELAASSLIFNQKYSWHLSFTILAYLTKEDGRVHVDEGGHWQDSSGEGRVEDLADGVVQHVSRVHPGVRHLDLRGVVALVIGL